MPRKIPTDHKHAPPGSDLPTAQPTDDACPNDARITAIERQLESLLNREQLPAVVGDGADHEMLEQRFTAIMRHVDTLREQVAVVNDQPRLSAADVSGLSSALNTRVEDMIEKAVSSLKIRVSTIERSSAPSLANEVQQLGKIVVETGKLVASLDERARDLEEGHQRSQARLQEVYQEFNGSLAKSLRLVSDGLQGASA